MEFRFKIYTGKYLANTEIFFKNMLGGYKMESYNTWLKSKKAKKEKNKERAKAMNKKQLQTW